MGLLYLTSVFSYNLDFTSGAARPCKIFNYISNTEARYNNACLKPKPETVLLNIQNYCKTALAKSSVNEGR